MRAPPRPPAHTLTNPAAGQAQKAFTIALGLLRSTVRPLEFFATASLAGAYFLSPATGKHPYLFIASAPVLLSIAIEKLKLSGVEFGVLRVQTSGERRGTGADVEVNGEVVRAGVDEWARWGIVRGMIVGSGFLLSLVGLYGDHK